LYSPMLNINICWASFDYIKDNTDTL
jgi:hypothetical protein